MADMCLYERGKRCGAGCRDCVALTSDGVEREFVEENEEDVIDLCPKCGGYHRSSFAYCHSEVVRDMK